MSGLVGVSTEKRTYLAKLVRKRFHFMYGHAHGVEYLSDPRYLGDNMTRKLRKEIEDFIFQFPTPDGTTSDERKEKLAQEYTAFRIDALEEREKNGFRFKMIGDSQSVLQWWMADGTDWPLLQNIAIRVFTMAALSAAMAASERNFSTFGFIHSKLSNRLSPDKVKKLVYIKTNTIQMSDSIAKCYEPESDKSDGMMEVNSEQKVVVQDFR